MSVDFHHLPPVAMVGEVRLASVSCVDVLDEGELVASVVSVVELDTEHLIIDLENVSTEELVINGKAVPAGMAVQFRVDLAGVDVEPGKYCLRVKVLTDSTPVQTRSFVVGMRVVSDEVCA